MKSAAIIAPAKSGRSTASAPTGNLVINRPRIWLSSSTTGAPFVAIVTLPGDTANTLATTAAWFECAETRASTSSPTAYVGDVAAMITPEFPRPNSVARLGIGFATTIQPARTAAVAAESGTPTKIDAARRAKRRAPLVVPEASNSCAPSPAAVSFCTHAEASARPSPGRAPKRLTSVSGIVFADAWGATFVDAGSHGHLGSAAQLGVWPFGLVAFGQFIASLRA